jgi:hypothetical protein
MRFLGASRYALTSCVAVAMLAGCGGLQPPMSSPVALMQSVAHGASASSGQLIYTSGPRDWIYMFDYPSGNFIGDFVPDETWVSGMCTDTNGDVYVLGFEDWSTILKYAHGATKPTSTIKLYQYDAFSCAVDPTTGNLAVLTNSESDQVVVVIYPEGSGTPTYYTLPAETQLARGDGCAYDDSGDLFADFQSSNYRADDIAELPAGGSSFSILMAKKNIRVKALQWVSPYLAAFGKGVVYRLAISGSSIRVIGQTKTKQSYPIAWIQDSKVLIGPIGRSRDELAYWNYPGGGKASKVIQRVNKDFSDLNSVVISTTGSQ